jgi:hypothetical protein
VAGELGNNPAILNREFDSELRRISAYTWIIHRISKKQRNPTIHTGLRCFGVS